MSTPPIDVTATSITARNYLIWSHEALQEKRYSDSFDHATKGLEIVADNSDEKPQLYKLVAEYYGKCNQPMDAVESVLKGIACQNIKPNTKGRLYTLGAHELMKIQDYSEALIMAKLALECSQDQKINKVCQNYITQINAKLTPPTSPKKPSTVSLIEVGEGGLTLCFTEKRSAQDPNPIGNTKQLKLELKLDE